jgi:hypothetical protein
LFSSLPPQAVLVGLNIPLALSLQMLLLGFHTRTASVATSVLLIVTNSFGYSLGKIDHDILLVLTPLILAFSGWGDAYSLDSLRRPSSQSDSPRGSWCLAMLALVIAIAMFTAGWTKLTSGWLDTNTHSAYGHLIINYAVTGRHTWLADYLLRIDSFWFWESADWVVTLMELGFLVAVFRARWMHFMLAIACLFHFGVWLLYDIVFMPNVVAYGAFVSYTSLPFIGRVAASARGRFRITRQAVVGIAICSIASLILFALCTGKPLGALSPLPIDRSIVVLGLVFGCGCLVVPTSALSGSLGAMNRLSIPMGASKSKRLHRMDAPSAISPPASACACYYCKWAVPETSMVTEN